MSRRLHITFLNSGRKKLPIRRWVILVSQGDWGCPILSYRAPAGEPLTFAKFVEFCCRNSRENVLERMHAKAARGLPVWFNDVPVPSNEVARLLALHDVETD
jgi:hypothetical protein